MISKEEVFKIAKLARLALSDTEAERMQKDMSAVLDYFDILKKAKLQKNSYVHRSVKQKENVTRKDIVAMKDASLANDLVRMAPKSHDGYIKVRTILS
jgi:aspartyl/glutamyl-tRNA(Asn/Gln) amidotransferase C subunit